MKQFLRPRFFTRQIAGAVCKIFMFDSAIRWKRSFLILAGMLVTFGSLQSTHASQNIYSAFEAVNCQNLLMRQQQVLPPDLSRRAENFRARALAVIETPAARLAVNQYFDRLLRPNDDDPQLRESLPRWIEHLESAINAFDPSSSLLSSGDFIWSDETIRDWIDFSQLALHRLKEASRSMAALTMTNILPLAIDYIAAISVMRATESPVWAKAASSAVVKLRRFESIFSNTDYYYSLIKFVTAFPFVQIQLTESDPTITGFVEDLIIPNVFVGITHELNQYDGSTVPIDPYEFGYVHDLLVHAFNTLTSFESIPINVNTGARSFWAKKIDPIALLNEIEHRIRLYERLYEKLARLDNVTRQAVIVMIFELTHELAYVETLNMDGIRNIRRKADGFLTADQIGIIIKRLTNHNDFGSDPGIRELAALAHSDAAETIRVLQNAQRFLSKEL